MRRLVLAEFTIVAFLYMLASLGFQRVFSGPGFITPLVGATALPMLIAAVGRFRRASSASTLLWSFFGFLLYTTYAALADTAPNLVPTLTTLRQLARGLTSGWAELLTVSLPADPQPRLLVPAIALTWCGATLGGEFAHRSRSAVAPVIPAIVVYLMTLALSASRPSGSLMLPLVFTATLLTVLLVHANRWALLAPAGLDGGDALSDPDYDEDLAATRRRLTTDTSPYRWIVLGVPVIALAVAAAGLLAVRVPVRDSRFDPRTLREQQVDVSRTVNPIDGLKAELALDPGKPPIRFTIERGGSEPASNASTVVPRIRLAVLDQFDGATWSSSGQFSRVDSELPTGPELDVATVKVVQTITLRSLGPGPWLPAADRAVRITGTSAADIAMEPSTGVLIASDGVVNGLRYTVESQVPRPTTRQLASIGPSDLSGGRSALADVPNMPAELRQIAQELVGDRQGPIARLDALEAALREGYGYSEQVPSGSSYGRLQQFLIEDRAGYAEQFAAAFATLARSLGYPTRLVYGYLTVEAEAPTGEGPLPEGASAIGNGSESNTTAQSVNVLSDITSRQAHVWPEVLLGDALWVPFEPTPPRVAGPLPPTQGGLSERESEGGVVANDTPPASEGSNGTVVPDRSDNFLLSTPFLAALTVVLAIAMMLGSLVLIKRLRRRRRRNGPSAGHQVLGAWAEVTDRLLEVGVAVDRTMTAKEVLALSAPLMAPRATERLTVMVPFVTNALYSPDPPQPEWAEEMWDHADAFHHEVLEGQQWYRGTVALLNPRPLLGAGRR